MRYIIQKSVGKVKEIANFVYGLILGGSSRMALNPVKSCDETLLETQKIMLYNVEIKRSTEENNINGD